MSRCTLTIAFTDGLVIVRWRHQRQQMPFEQSGRNRIAKQSLSRLSFRWDGGGNVPARASKRFTSRRLLGQPVLALSLASGNSTAETELGPETVETVGSVQVLDDHNLEASGATLPGSDDRPCEEKLPNLRREGESQQRYFRRYTTWAEFDLP